jgi:hypothetical protein
MGLNLGLDKFIERATEKHIGKFDYSKVVYKNNKTKIIITCPEHGDFEQRPDKHLRGEACPNCGGTKKINLKIFLDKAKTIHGNTYDYSKVIIKNIKEKAIIICREHGEFEQRLCNHLKGEGCRKCGYLKEKNVKKLTNEDFINRANEKHGDKFDYSKVIYENIKCKVIIICPEHGDFEQRANNHLRGEGCPKCNGGVVFDLEKFISKSNTIHNSKYDYSKVVYENNKLMLTITCPEHGDFKQRAGNHLRGDGCPKCSNNKKLNTEDIIERAIKVHGRKYGYSKVVSGVNVSSKIIITCEKHGDFKQTINTHLGGAGCRKCKESRGETQVRVFLEENNIEHTPQYTFSECKVTRPLPFDFYLPKYNMCIEYNGLQHYKPFERFGGEKAFESQKKRDAIKKEYCEKNNIMLLVIKYDQNVNNILNKILLNL